MGRGGRSCAMLLVAILLLVLPAGCATAPPPVSAPPEPKKPSVQPWHLPVVASPSSTQQAEIAAFRKNLEHGGIVFLAGQQADVPAGDHHWTRLAPSQVPAKLVPKDTLGRGLLVAYGTSSRLTTPTPADPVADLELLFEGGLVCWRDSLVPGEFVNLSTAPGSSRWPKEVADAVARSGKHGSATATSVGSALALVKVGRGTRTHKAEETIVWWGVPPWTYWVSLPGTDTAAALRVARSVAR
jgi:hypothetical protein